MSTPYEPTTATLEAVKDLIVNGLDMGDGFTMPLVVIWPDESELVKGIAAKDLPVIIISEQFGYETRIEGTAARGKTLFHWAVEILVLVAEAPTLETEEMAAAETKMKGWRAAFWRLFYNNLTLKGSVDMIGSIRDNQLVPFTAFHTTQTWGTQAYMAVVISMPVRQSEAVLTNV